jgi:hypothetical protein
MHAAQDCAGNAIATRQRPGLVPGESLLLHSLAVKLGEDGAAVDQGDPHKGHQLGVLHRQAGGRARGEAAGGA